MNFQLHPAKDFSDLSVESFQDHDLETMYLDSFLKLSALEGADITETYETLKTISDKYHVTFVLSISMDADELPECAKGDVIISL